MKEKYIRYVNSKTAVLIYTPVNRRYLTGFQSSLGYLLLTEKENFLFVDGRYFEAACKIASNAKVLIIESLFDQINRILLDNKIEKVLIEVENEIRFLNNLKIRLNARVIASEPLSRRLAVMRSIKSKEEVESIILAQRIAEKAFSDVLQYIRIGITEREIAAFLEYRMKLYGSEGETFETIAVSGPNSSLPHGVPSDRKISDGDFITMDFGAKTNGYCSDMTRTVAVGSVTDEMEKVYNTVLLAQQKVIETVAAGVDCKTADTTARELITKAGYEAYFNHSTGHGIGLEVHELPNVSPRSEGIKLRVGQVISDEPGIYIPGKFGVRIEDMLIITKSGCKNLTKAPKHLIIL